MKSKKQFFALGVPVLESSTIATRRVSHVFIWRSNSLIFTESADRKRFLMATYFPFELSWSPPLARVSLQSCDYVVACDNKRLLKLRMSQAPSTSQSASKIAADRWEIKIPHWYRKYLSDAKWKLTVSYRMSTRCGWRQYFGLFLARDYQRSVIII